MLYPQVAFVETAADLLQWMSALECYTHRNYLLDK